MAEQAIYDQLTGVTALGSRIYPLVLPQNVEYPAASYQRISAIRYSQFGRDATAAEATVQVDIYGRRDGQASRHSTPSLSPAGRPFSVSTAATQLI